MILRLSINNRKEKQIIRPWLRLKKAISMEREREREKKNDNERENAKNKQTNKQKQKQKQNNKRQQQQQQQTNKQNKTKTSRNWTLALVSSWHRSLMRQPSELSRRSSALMQFKYMYQYWRNRPGWFLSIYIDLNPKIHFYTCLMLDQPLASA